MATRPTPIPREILERKGARTTAAVPSEVRRLLAEGRIETANLCEWLVVDQAALAQVVLASNGWKHLIPPVQAGLSVLATPTAPKRMEVIGRVLAAAFTSTSALDKAHEMLRSHTSDVVRSWSGYMVGLSPHLSLRAKLDRVRPLAADTNMGVRETAWFAVRDSLAADLPAAFRLLEPWVKDPDPNVRRFASEATRPRGVWCRHIDALKQDPTPGLVLLEPLRSDPSKYVRDSVANWLNDASKSHPDWVRNVTTRWLKESPTPETEYVARRACRTMTKRARAAVKGSKR